MIRIRNKTTGEVRDIDENSEEWSELRLEAKPDGNSKWEQLGEHQHQAVSQRAEEGSLRTEDLGDEDQQRLSEAPVDSIAQGPDPTKDLTEGERESGLESWEQKEEQLRDTFGKKVAHVEEVLEDAADKVRPRRQRGRKSSAKAVEGGDN